MMGQLPTGHNSLFDEFCIEQHIPSNHLLRRIDTFLDLSNLRQYLTAFYSATGGPSVDCELMVRMLIIGYCCDIRSERCLCEEVHLNLAYRWFCRLDPEDEVPDHSTFEKDRRGRFRESEAFSTLFEDVVARCMAEDLVRGAARMIKAGASRRRGVTGGEEVDQHDSANFS